MAPQGKRLLFCSLLFLFSAILMILPAAGNDSFPDPTTFIGVNAPDRTSQGSVKDAPGNNREILGKTGIAFERICFDRSILQTAPLHFRWEIPDRMIRDARNDGIRILSTIRPGDANARTILAPRNEEERENFALFCSRLVERYKNRIKYWELWSEPDSSKWWSPMPDPASYSKLLKSVYREVKIADRKTLLLAPACSNAPLPYLEKIYENGAGDFFDILSFHHMAALPLDEIDLRMKLVDLKYLMNRYVDGEKRIWITRMGISEPACDEPLEKRAAWMVKSIVTAMASRKVDRIFWNSLYRDGEESCEALAASEYTLTRLGDACHTLTRLLKKTKYQGPVFIHPRVTAYLFQRGRKGTLVLWTREEKVRIALRTEDDVTLTDIFGKETAIQPEKEFIQMSLTGNPVFLTGMDYRSTRYLSSLQIQPEHEYIHPGEKKTLTLCFDKSFSRQAVEGQVMISAPDGIKVQPSTIKLSPGIEKRIQLEASPWMEPGYSKLEIEYQITKPFSHKRGGLYLIRVMEPVSIAITGKQVDHGFRMITQIRNTCPGPISGSLEWQLEPRGKVQISPIGFQDLSPNDEITTYSGLMAGNLEARLLAVVKDNNGTCVKRGIGLMPMPFRLVAPNVDGSLREWTDMPVLTLGTFPQIVQSDDAYVWSPKNLEAKVRFWWTEDALYISAMVKDDDPLRNPFYGSEINRGDCLEIFLGLDGSHENAWYADKDLHIGLSPGHKGRMPEIWMWTGEKPIREGRIVSCRTDNGYQLEAKIPAEALGSWKPEHDTMIGFDIALHDLDQKGRNTTQCRLVWSQQGGSLHDPSQWGVAIVR